MAILAILVQQWLPFAVVTATIWVLGTRLVRILEGHTRDSRELDGMRKRIEFLEESQAALQVEFQKLADSSEFMQRLLAKSD